MKEHVLIELSRSYPQLLFDLDYETKNSQEYINAVRRGIKCNGIPSFSFSSGDSLEYVDTPAGEVQVLFLEDRKDFEHCVCALAYRCEPRKIPESMGAVTVSGLINREKINKYVDNFEENGETDREAAFRHFTADKNNYLDSIIILSSGYYSAVLPERVGISQDSWRELSLEIRKYHELTHFVCRKLYPDNKDSIRDEVFADMMGIVKAFGHYDTYLARVFLGTQAGEYRKGGRIENYTDDNLNDVFVRVNRLIDEFERLWLLHRDKEFFAALTCIFEDYIKITD